ncbi:MAG: hypothetical protein A2132_00905 [Nitrospirae bacterium RBG_16_43_11]|nr:MAG: hypothetical protein A2132_00905 [Nitrospirae bacterium RBG_16_43_11]
MLDLNNPVFQDDLFNLGKEDAIRILEILKKIRSLTWTAIYKDNGLRWELVQSRTGLGGQRLYTIRISQKFRAIVYREAQFMRFLSLHPDHDSAYE